MARSKPSPNRARLAVPPTATRSSERWSDIASTSAATSTATGPRWPGSNSSGSSDQPRRRRRRAARRRSSRLSRPRRSAIRVLVERSGGSSTTRCSTRPVERISTTSTRAAVSGTTSTCRTVERDSVGYCTIATCRVSWASSRTLRCTTSSRSMAPSSRVAIARLSAALQRLDLAEPVDEQPVALVGGDPAGAGVRLGDEPLLLQRGHVVADGRRARRRAGAGRPAPWSRPAPGWRRSPRRSRAARRACGPRPSTPPRRSAAAGTRLALSRSECQAYRLAVASPACRTSPPHDAGFVEVADRVLGGPLRVVRRQRRAWSAASAGLLVVDTHASERRRPRGRRARPPARRRRRRRGGQHPRALRPHLRQRACFAEAYDGLPIYAHEAAADGPCPPAPARPAAVRPHEPDDPAPRRGRGDPDRARPTETFSSARVARPRRPARRAGAPRPRSHRRRRWSCACADADVLLAGDLVEESALRGGVPGFGDDCYPMEWPATLDLVLGLLTPGTVVVPGPRRCRSTATSSRSSAPRSGWSPRRSATSPPAACRSTTRWPRPSGPTRASSSRTPYAVATSTCRARRGRCP